MQNGPHVQSVSRALDILEALAAEPAGRGVSDLARALRLKAPTVHNLLRTLASRGYVYKDESTQRYRLGFNCARLGRAYLGALRVPEAARPVIEALALRLNESVVVATIEQGEIAFVARATGTQMLAVDFERSWTEAGHRTACGRVILAHLPTAALERYLAAHPIAKAGCEDIRSRKDLDAVLQKARRNGHLEYLRENRTVLAIAAPIRDHTGAVAGAVGVGMPAVRCTSGQRPMIVEAVRQAAGQISVRLGHKGGSDVQTPQA